MNNKNPEEKVDEEQTLIKTYIAEYMKIDDEYNKTNEYYNDKINKEIEKINLDSKSSKVVEITNEANAKMEEILERLNEATKKILSLQSYRDNYMKNKTISEINTLNKKETISKNDKEQITQYMNDLIKQKTFFDNEVEKYNDNVHDYSNKVVVRKSNEIQVTVYVFIFIGVLCLIAKVYFTESVGYIETIVLIFGISVILYHFVDYFNRH